MPWQDSAGRCTFYDWEKWKGEISIVFSLLWHSFTRHETHPVQTTRAIQLCACNRTQLLAVTLSNTAGKSRTSKGEFHSGQRNFPVTQVSPLPTDGCICLLQDTNVGFQERVLQEAVNCKLGWLCPSYSLSYMLSQSALILSCSLVLFSTAQVPYFPLERENCLEERCYTVSMFVVCWSFNPVVQPYVQWLFGCYLNAFLY